MKKEAWNKTSKDYYTEILSPLKNSKSNPLFSNLKKLRSKSNSVIDLGCGLGELEPLLSKYFKHIAAIDFSPEMIAKASSSHSNLSNVSFETANLSNLSKYKNQFKLALSINSLLNPDLNEIDKQLSQIYKTLKPNGTFIAILPAMEVYIYQAQLLNQKGSKLFKDYTNQKEHNFPLGVINFEGKQKCFYHFEINQRLTKAGFKNIKISKVLYSWDAFKQAGQLSFPKEPEPWDWYVICEK